MEMRLSTLNLLLPALMSTCAVASSADNRPIQLGKQSDIYVSPGGNDSASGSKGKPFATLERARDAMRAMKLAAGQTAAVWLNDGIYRRTEPFKLDAADFGGAGKIVYRAVNPGRAIISGGTPVAPSAFGPVTNPEALSRMRPEARPHILKLDLDSSGLKNIKPVPDTFDVNGYDGNSIFTMVELFYQGKRMQLARYPNEGFLAVKKMLFNGKPELRHTDPVIADLQAKSAEEWNGPDNPKHGPVFIYRDPRHAAWTKAVDHGMWLQGYWCVEWLFTGLKPRLIDSGKQIVKLTAAHWRQVGSLWEVPYGDGEEPYMAMNLLEEISRPGNWCVDYKDRALYFWPPSALKVGDVTISDSTQPLISVNGASNILFRDIVFEEGLRVGVDIENSIGVVLASCTFRHFSDFGVVISGGRDCGVQSCDMYSMGNGCISLQQFKKTPKPEEIKPADLEQTGNFAVNNHLHHYSEVYPVYGAAVRVGFEGRMAIGNRVANNLIHDSPHGGILYGGRNNTIEYNEMYHMCTTSGDLGGIYSAVNSKRAGTVGFGDNIIRYNLEHHSPFSRGVYIDFEQHNDLVHGNIAYKINCGYLLKVGDKSPHHATNNVAIDCETGFNVYKLPDNVYENNITIKSGLAQKDMKGAESDNIAVAGARNLSLETNSVFMDPEKLDFRLKPDSTIAKELPGFKPIPVEKIGLYVDEHRKKLPAELTSPERFKYVGEGERHDISCSTFIVNNPAWHAFDGSVYTGWGAEGRLPQWLQKDLGSVKTVIGSELYFNRPERCAHGYTIEYSTNGATWTTYADRAGNKEPGDPCYTDIKEVEARHLRLNYLTLLKRDAKGVYNNSKHGGRFGVMEWKIKTKGD